MRAEPEGFASAADEAKLQVGPSRLREYLRGRVMYCLARACLSFIPMKPMALKGTSHFLTTILTASRVVRCFFSIR